MPMGVYVMARGKSGRVVLEIDPEFKNQLYQALGTRNQTLKEWFVEEAELMIQGECVYRRTEKKNEATDPSDKENNE
jgi:hypothetical protein